MTRVFFRTDPSVLKSESAATPLLSLPMRFGGDLTTTLKFKQKFWPKLEEKQDQIYQNHTNKPKAQYNQCVKHRPLSKNPLSCSSTLLVAGGELWCLGNALVSYLVAVL